MQKRSLIAVFVISTILLTSTAAAAAAFDLSSIFDKLKIPTGMAVKDESDLILGYPFEIQRTSYPDDGTMPYNEISNSYKVTLNVGESITSFNKKILLENVGSNGHIIIDVGGVKETLKESRAGKRVNSIKIINFKSYYSDTYSKRKATLVIEREFNKGKSLKWQASMENLRFVKGISGKALQFDGKDDYIIVYHNDELSFPKSDFSISLWFKSPLGKGYKTLIDKGYEEAYYLTFQNNVFRPFLHGHNKVMKEVTVNDNEWHHLVMSVKRNGDVLTYLDNKLKDEWDISKWKKEDWSSTQNLLIGRYARGEYFPGTLDEIKIYKKALTAAEVEAEYDAAQEKPTPTSYRDYTISSVTERLYNATGGTDGIGYNATAYSLKIEGSGNDNAIELISSPCSDKKTDVILIHASTGETPKVYWEDPDDGKANYCGKTPFEIVFKSGSKKIPSKIYTVSYDELKIKIGTGIEQEEPITLTTAITNGIQYFGTKDGEAVASDVILGGKEVGKNKEDIPTADFIVIYNPRVNGDGNEFRFGIPPKETSKKGTKHLFVTDDTSPPSDVAILLNVREEVDDKILAMGDSVLNYLNSEVTRDMLDNRVTTFIYNAEAAVIVGKNSPVSHSVLSVDIENALVNEGVPVIKYLSMAVKDDDLKKLIPEEQTPTKCTDSDGNNYYKKGTCSDSSSTRQDFCYNEYVWEYTCSDEGKCILTESFRCKYDCREGACIKEPTPEPTECKDGCLYNQKCLKVGIRVKEKFCSIDGELIDQKDADEKCINNFECQSNLCIDDKCIKKGLFQRVLAWFTALFKR